MADVGMLVAERRTRMGTAESRRLRKRGVVPGNVYGHGEDPVAIAVPAASLVPIVNSGSKVVDLNLDGTAKKVMFRELQWDTFGQHIQHFDVIWIAADERVTVEVPVELRGNAPGIQAGGVMEQSLRTLTIECLALQIPESIRVRIGALEVGQAIHVSDVEVPNGANVLNPPEAVIVQVVEHAAEDEEGDDAAASAEPEVIGRKAEDEEEK